MIKGRRNDVRRDRGRKIVAENVVIVRSDNVGKIIKRGDETNPTRKHGRRKRSHMKVRKFDSKI